MLTLEFTENNNGKLFTDHFTHIEMSPSGYRIGEKLEVMLNGISLGIVKVEAKRKLYPIHQLTDAESFINIGKPAHYQAALLNRSHNAGETHPLATSLTLMVLGYTERNIENQTLLITEWWNSKKLKSSV